MILCVGFLSTEDQHAPGNWGLFDQQMALDFVRQNIQKFRGDPKRITLAGDGAGGVSVGMHMISTMSRGKSECVNCVAHVCCITKL